MKKDAYYFSHDANAQDDPKCIMLIHNLGAEGYGIFWLLIEKLRAEKGFCLPFIHLNTFAIRWNTSVSMIEKVIKDYNLFKISKDGNFFYSDRLRRSMKEKSDKAKRSISFRWNNTNEYDRKRSNTTDIQTNTIKGKERKGKNNNANSHFSDEKKQPLLHKGQTLRDKEILEKMKNDPLFDPFDDTPTGEVLPPGEGMVF